MENFCKKKKHTKYQGIAPNEQTKKKKCSSVSLKTKFHSYYRERRSCAWNSTQTIFPRQTRTGWESLRINRIWLSPEGSKTALLSVITTRRMEDCQVSRYQTQIKAAANPFVGGKRNIMFHPSFIRTNKSVISGHALKSKILLYRCEILMSWPFVWTLKLKHLCEVWTAFTNGSCQSVFPTM